MAIHIGNIIREVVKAAPLTNKQITDKLNLSPNALYHFYKVATIDTGTLLRLCEILHYDFFAHFYQEKPLKNMRQHEMEKLQEHVHTLKALLAQKEETINELKALSAVQKERLLLMEEKARDTAKNKKR